MSRKRNKPIYVGTISSYDLFKMSKPRSYEVVTCRGGIHGDTKYNRRKTKAETRRIIENDE